MVKKQTAKQTKQSTVSDMVQAIEQKLQPQEEEQYAHPISLVKCVTEQEEQPKLRQHRPLTDYNKFCKAQYEKHYKPKGVKYIQMIQDQKFKKDWTEQKAKLEKAKM